jgi:hypothetical protein
MAGLAERHAVGEVKPVLAVGIVGSPDLVVNLRGDGVEALVAAV